MEINVLIEEGIETGPEAAWMQAIVEKTLLEENVPTNIEISLIITGQERIQELNREYRGEDRPTDVLSFAMAEQKEDEEMAPFIGPPDGLVHLGEVIISYPQAVRQSQERGHTVRRELMILIVHGALHILGYDHEKPEMEPAMVAREKEILAALEKEEP
jgi:probable rRNA maturation factor